MSEIYSPGSIAGPTGATGAAGSLANVKSLTDAVLPNMGNRFDYTRVAADVSVGNDGALYANPGMHTTPMIYCAGATAMVANFPVEIGNPGVAGAHIATYDANGNFIECLDSDYLSGVATANSLIVGSTVWPLKGTQTYVRWTYAPSWLSGSYGWVTSEDKACVYAGTTAVPPSIPAKYEIFGFDTPTDVNAKDAAVLASATAAIASLTEKVGAGLSLFNRVMLPAIPAGQRNALDRSQILENTGVHQDGTITTESGWTSAYVFAQGATQFNTNLPVFANLDLGGGFKVDICCYDAFGNFLSAAGSSNGLGGACLPNQVYSLPGDQTYVAFTWSRGHYGWGPKSNGQYEAASDGAALFMVGDAANPCPASGALPNCAPTFGSHNLRVKYATELGADPTGAVDSTAVLNAFLATASATHPLELILDGWFLTTGLAVAAAGYTTISGIGWGSGLFLIAGSNRNAITIGTGTAGDYSIFGTNTTRPIPVRTCANVKLSNFTLDPNCANNINSHGAGFVNTTNITIDNMNFKAATWFAAIFSNCGFIKASGSQFISGNTTNDGLHYCGPCEDITIDSCYFATGDDSIAINCPEGFGGDIARVAVSNCVFNGSLSVMRIYTSIDATHLPGGNNVHKARSIVVSNCTGYTYNNSFTLGVSMGPSCTSDVDQIEDLTVSNCTLSSPQGFVGGASVPMGSITFRGVKFIPVASSDHGGHPGTAAVFSLWSPYSIAELTFDDFAILRNASGNSTPVALLSTNAGSSIGRLTLNNTRVLDEAGSSYSAIPALLDINGTVAQLRIDALDMAHFAAITSAAGWVGISALRGAGALEAGVQVPDSVMDANTVYLSSNAGGAPSIKLGATAKRLSLT